MKSVALYRTAVPPVVFAEIFEQVLGLLKAACRGLGALVYRFAQGFGFGSGVHAFPGSPRLRRCVDCGPCEGGR